jgi:hypothetical protein
MLLMLRPNAADERFVENKLTEGIARHRFIFFSLLVVLYAVSFNGQWRIGHDSAIYRGLGSSLASGRGYVFGEWATHQAYPGLPWLLAGVQRLLGVQDDLIRPQGAFAFVGRRIDTTASVLVILSMSALTLVLTYRLIRLHYPQWMAVCVVFGVGINSWFLQLSHELLTDVPFLLGVVMALYGWELLKRALTWSGGAGALGLIVAGLALAGSMRPMFWVVGVSWIMVCMWALLRGDRRRLHFLSLAVLLAVWAVLILADPRHQGFNPLAGGYERELLEVLPEAPLTLPQRLYDAMRNELPPAFFGEQMSPFSILASVVVLGSCLLLFRQHPLWAWMVFVAFGVTLVTSTESRYYIMILPMMLLGWLLLLIEIARRLPARTGAVLLGLGLGLVTATNITGSIGFVREQRRGEFIEEFKRGKYVALLKMSDLIRARVGEDERVLGPLAPILTYVSGRQVLSQREVLPRGSVLSYPQALFDARLNYAVFPSSIYRVKEPVIARLMERNLLYSIRKIGSADEWYLGRVRVRIPPGDWRELPRGWQPPPEPPKKKKPVPTTAATQPARRKPAPATPQPVQAGPTTAATRPALPTPSPQPKGG